MGLSFYYADLKSSEAVVLDAKTHYYVIVSEDNNLLDPNIIKVDSPLKKSGKNYDIQLLDNNEQFQETLFNVYPEFHRKLIKTILE